MGAAFLADHFRNIKDPENVLVSRDLWFDNLPAVMRVRITTPNLGAGGGICSVEAIGARTATIAQSYRANLLGFAQTEFANSESVSAEWE
jgi:hypothetical protein